MTQEFKPRHYKGWRIEGKGHGGMYSATKGWSLLQGDTVAGLKRLITRTEEKRA